MCYVLGCSEPSIVGRIHNRFGRVNSCDGHDPDRHGVAKPFYTADVSQLATRPPSHDGGTKVPRKMPVPRFPSPGTTVKPF